MTKYIAHQTLDREDALARGREVVTKIRALLKKSALKFDESQVVRNKAKGHEGEFAAKRGMTYAPDPAFISEVKEQVEATLAAQYQEHEHRKSKGGPVTPWEDIPLDAIKERVTATAREVLARAVPTVRVPDFVAIKILQDGRLKSQHESGRSGGVLDPGYRAEAETQMFGTDAKGDLKERPIYGVMIEDFAEAQHGMNQARSYGDAIFVLKDSILDRTTVSFGDSLADAHHYKIVAPRPYREFDWVGVGGGGGQLTNDSTVDKMFHYVEAQFHGGVTLDDVKEVVVPHSLYTYWESSGTLAKFKEKGVAVRVIAPGPHKARV